MNENSETDAFSDDGRAFLTSAELEKIHTLHRQKLREQMSKTLDEHITKARDRVAEEARSD